MTVGATSTASALVTESRSMASIAINFVFMRDSLLEYGKALLLVT
jgi:hypothetical protein